MVITEVLAPRDVAVEEGQDSGIMTQSGQDHVTDQPKIENC